MKYRILSQITAWILLGVTCLGSPNPVSAAEEESAEARINQAVKEAQELAQQWATRIQEWKSGESSSRTYMGVVIESVPDVLRDYIDLPKGVGLLLVRIAKDGPADKAGLQDNDILVEFDGQLVVNYSQLSTLIDIKGPAATVPVKVLRKGKALNFEITLEERAGQASHPAPPSPPPHPGVGAIPDPAHPGGWVGNIDEWIPGSVRIYIDDEEQVHVDLQELKENMDDLETKLKYLQVLQCDVPGLVREHGDEGARTTVVRMADKNINYACKDGKVALTSSEAGQNAIIWDAQGNLIYEGDVPVDYESKLPPKAAELIRALQQSGNKLHLGTGSEDLEIHLNQDHLEPVTWNR